MPERDDRYRVIEYMKRDGKVRDIYTDTLKYPPQYSIAKYVQEEKDNDPGSFFNEPFNPEDWNNPISHVRVYDIVNHGWRTLRVWRILTDVDGSPSLPTCSDDWKKVHDELVKAVEEKDRNLFKYYIDKCEYGCNHVLMSAIGPLISQYFTKCNISKKKNDIHKELLEKVDMDTNWAEKYQKSLQDNQRLKKRLGKWVRRSQDFMDKCRELKDDLDRISSYKIR